MISGKMAFIDTEALFDSAAQDYDRSRLQYTPCFDELYGTSLEPIPHDSQDHVRVLDLGAGTDPLSRWVVTPYPNDPMAFADASTGILGQAKGHLGANPIVRYISVNHVDSPIVGCFDPVIPALSQHFAPRVKLNGVIPEG